MLGYKAYDGTELREELDENGTKPVIPNRSMILGRIATHYEKMGPQLACLRLSCSRPRMVNLMIGP